MKICLIQPPYSLGEEGAEECFRKELSLLASCGEDGKPDLIVLPEYADVLFAAKDRAALLAAHERFFPRLFDACREAARKNGAIVFFNALDRAESGNWRNATWALGRDGEIAGKYGKRHLPPLERDLFGLDTADADGPRFPEIVEIDGLRFAFLTCYDFYFYEAFPLIARERPDFIIGCSLQRSDRHDASEIMCRHLAYNTNAYVLRSSVSMEGLPGAIDGVCGATMAVSPDGRVLSNLFGKVGALSVEIDPAVKYRKPAGFGRAPAPHWEYAEYGRNPYQYRPAGPGTVLSDERMPYPRICAHRGFNTVAPENSLPAFGAAVALGAEEIEFDLWETKDGEIVSIHDAGLERVSNGTGYVWEHTLAELETYDFGSKAGPEYEGLPIVRFEEILEKFSCRTVMNIHVKAVDDERPLPEAYLEKMIRLIRKYDAQKHCYFMSGNPAVLRQLGALAPDIPRCAGADEDPHRDLVEKALACDCTKIQLFSPHFPSNPPEFVKEQIDKAHENGIRVNLFYSDRREEAAEYLALGVDTILTNDYNRVAKAKGYRLQGVS